MKGLFSVDIIGQSRLHQPSERLSWAPSRQERQIHSFPPTHPHFFFLSYHASLLSWLRAWCSRVLAEATKALTFKHSNLFKSYCKACGVDWRYHGQNPFQCLVSCLYPFFLLIFGPPCTHGNTCWITGCKGHNYTYTRRLIKGRNVLRSSLAACLHSGIAAADRHLQWSPAS